MIDYYELVELNNSSEIALENKYLHQKRKLFDIVIGLIDPKIEHTVSFSLYPDNVLEVSIYDSYNNLILIFDTEENIYNYFKEQFITKGQIVEYTYPYIVDVIESEYVIK